MVETFEWKKKSTREENLIIPIVTVE